MADTSAAPTLDWSSRIAQSQYHSSPSDARIVGSAAYGTGMVVIEDSSLVSAAQDALNRQGYGAVPVDGVMNPRTEAALRNFQYRHGLQATGELDSQTIVAPGI